MNELVLSIEHSQRISVATDGTATRGYETYIREYIGILESGLMARLSNAAYKTLHALALRARLLGDPRRPGAEEEFHELLRLGVVSNDDKGLLFCFPSREQLMKDTGIGSAHTIDAAMLELSALNLIKRITPAQPRLGRGLFGSNLYIIHPESFISKFMERHSDGRQQAPPVSAQTEGNFCSLKSNNKGDQQEEKQEQLTIIAHGFARAIGVEHYEPNEQERHRLVTFLAEGYECEEICEIIQQVVAREQAKGKHIRSLAYCFPAIRDQRSRRHTIQPTRPAEPETQVDAVSRTPPPSAETGSPLAELPAVTSSALDLLAEGNRELRDLLEVVQERNPGRALQKSDVRVWRAVAERFRNLADARETTPIGLVMQAVLKAISAHSDRAGYFAPRLAETILEEWQREEARKREEQKDAEAAVVEERCSDGLSATQEAQAEGSVPSKISLHTPEGAHTHNEVWNMALKELRGQMTKATFDTWVKATWVAAVHEGDVPTWVIGTRNPYAVEWLEQRLHTTIERTLVGILGKKVVVRYVCSDQ